MRQIFYILAISTFISCQSTTKDKGQENQTIPYHQDDQFAYDPFGFPVTVDNLIQEFRHLNRTATPIHNTHNLSVMDTIYKLSIGKTELEIYRAQDKDIFISAFIDTGSIILKDNIMVGMTKADFADKFGLTITTNKLEIGNLESTKIWTFTFIDDRLITMEYSGYLD